MYRESLKQRLRFVEWLGKPLEPSDQIIGREWMRNPLNFPGREARRGPITRSSSIDDFWRALLRYFTERYNLVDGWPAIIGMSDRALARLTPVEYATRTMRRAPFTKGSVIKIKGSVFHIIENGRSIMYPGRTLSVHPIMRRPRAIVPPSSDFLIIP